MFFLLNAFSICQLYEITNQAMEVFALESGDEILINVTASDYFLHIQNHFYYGTLDITIFNTTTQKEFQIKADVGYALHFSQCTLHIKYTSPSATCKITIWAINSGTCNNDSIYYSDISIASLKLRNISIFKVCYFFDLLAKPKINSSTPSFDSILYYMSDDGTLIQNKIHYNITDISIPKLSILKISHNINYNVSYDFQIATDLQYVDFTAKESFFKNCIDNVCDNYNCSSVPIFVVERYVCWWLWMILYLVPTILLTIGVSLLLLKPKTENSFFSSTKLVSDNIRNSSISAF